MNMSPIHLQKARNKIIKSGQNDLMSLVKNHAEHDKFRAADVTDEKNILNTLQPEEIAALETSSKNNVEDAKLYLIYLYYLMSSEALLSPSVDTTEKMRQYPNTIEFILKNDKKNDNSHLAYLLADFYIEHKALDDTFEERGKKIMKALLVMKDRNLYNFVLQKLDRRPHEVIYDKDHYAYQFVNLLMNIIKQTPTQKKPSHLFDDILAILAKNKINPNHAGYQHSADYAKALDDLHGLQNTMLEKPKSMLGKIAKGVNLPESLKQTAESYGKGRSDISIKIFAALSDININSIKKGGIQTLKNLLEEVNKEKHPAARSGHELK